MAPFKDQLSTEAIAALADALAAAWPPFPRDAVVARATDGLEALELKARAAQVEAALAPALPRGEEELAATVDRLLADPDLGGWALWPLLDAITAVGLARPAATLELLRRLTPRWTAEAAVRPLIDRHPDVAFPILAGWTRDPDEHVRRLVSEGTRPRLPWSPRLRALQADPTPALPLLDALRDDPSGYVRRSVANHLGDIAKDHPALAVEIAGRWLADGGAHVEAVVRHGLRALVKAGDPGALALLGADVEARIRVLAFTAEPVEIAIGGSVEVACTLVSDEGAEALAEIDLRVAYANAEGALTRRKTFKLARRTLPPGEPVTVRRRQPFRPVSIRALHPGEHLLELQVNGRIAAATTVVLVAPEG